MKYYVYILFSQKNLKYYVGQTHNIEQRLERHNRGTVQSTKNGLPWQLVTTFELGNRSEAMKLEHKIKKRGIKRFLKGSQFGV